MWSFSTGHARYAVMLEVFSSLYVLIWLFDLFALKRQVWREVFTYLLAASVLLAAYFSHQTDYAMRPMALKPLWITFAENGTLAADNAALQQEHFDDYLFMVGINMPYIGRDRQVTSDPALQQRLAAVKTWVCFETGSNNSLMIMANPEADFLFFNNYWQNTQGREAAFIRELLPFYDEMSLYTISDGAADPFLPYCLANCELYGLAVVEYEVVNLEMTLAYQPNVLLRLMTVETAERLGYTPFSYEDIMYGWLAYE
jgi:hypothetical protein